MSTKAITYDFVTERMQLSKQFPELAWEEYCIAFDMAWRYATLSGFDHLRQYAHDFAEVAVKVKQCARN